MIQELVITAMLLCPQASEYKCEHATEAKKQTFIYATTQWEKINEKTIYYNNKTIKEVDLERKDIRN